VCQIPEELKRGAKPLPVAPGGVQTAQDIHRSTDQRGGPPRQGKNTPAAFAHFLQLFLSAILFGMVDLDHVGELYAFIHRSRSGRIRKISASRVGPSVDPDPNPDSGSVESICFWASLIRIWIN
jgi:hypothetical protein